MSTASSLEHKILERIGVIARAQQRVNREGKPISDQDAQLWCIQETFELNNLIQAAEFPELGEEIRDAAIAVYGLMLPQAKAHYETNMLHLKVDWVDPTDLPSSTITN